MRFKSELHHVHTFSKLVSSLSSLGPIAWVRLDEESVGFTVIPEQGTQVWAVIAIESIFGDDYVVESNANNSINIELPLGPFVRALRSAINAESASIRLTKKNDRPVLSLTVKRSCSVAIPGSNAVGPLNVFTGQHHSDDEIEQAEMEQSPPKWGDDRWGQTKATREAIITQDIPIRVLAPATVQGLHEPHCKEPDVHIVLPPLAQLKAVSDRFTRLALSSRQGVDSSTQAGDATSGSSPRLEMAANMHGCLRLRLILDSVEVQTVWTGLLNPELNPENVAGGEEGIRNHPSTRMRELGDSKGRSEEGWASVRIDGRDWGKVMSVGRMGGRVIACFCDNHALILYVYIEDDEGEHESVLTYYVGSYAE